MVSITAEELAVFSQYVKTETGIVIEKEKAYLLENRLSSLLRDEGCATFSELYYKIKSDRRGALRNRVVDLITTGETLFFRDASPFELLRHKIIPDLVDRRSRATSISPPLPIPIKIWSAACSSGQEVYSTAIVLREVLGDLKRYSIRLLGTDISDNAVARASYGAYNRFEMERGLPPAQLAKYFAQVGDTDSWKVRDEIRAMAAFQKLNLLSDFRHLGKFDIVMCRNVAIYFSEEDKKKLFDKVGEVLDRDGYLIVGSTESISGLCPQFESKRHLRSIFYQLADKRAAR
jgi:chemotaxis protein methyltransferase CheR